MSDNLNSAQFQLSAEDRLNSALSMDPTPPSKESKQAPVSPDSMLEKKQETTPRTIERRETEFTVKKLKEVCAPEMVDNSQGSQERQEQQMSFRTIGFSPQNKETSHTE